MAKNTARLIVLSIPALFSIFMTFSDNNPRHSKNLNIMPAPSNDTNSFSVLTANVGNLSIGCMDVLNKLCYKDVEERITENVRRLSPDIVAFQEVLAPWQCENAKTNDRNKVCYEKQSIPQARRLLGSQYTIACADREQNQFECIAVKTSVGSILGCEQGQLCSSARTSGEVDGCDNGFTVSAVTIKLISGFTFDIVNFHPQSTNAHCRAKMIATAFEGNETNPPLIQEDKVLLLGDFNLDPWRDDDESVIAWKEFLSRGWGGKDFVYHSGIVEKDPPYYTSFLFYKKRTPDMVVSNFAQGVCNVLGESPNTSRLDGGKGTDHRALYGILAPRP